MNTNYNGWSTKSAWDLAVTIDNTEYLHNEANIIIHEYQKRVMTIQECAYALSEYLGNRDVPYTFNDAMEYIVTNQGTPRYKA